MFPLPYPDQALKGVQNSVDKVVFMIVYDWPTAI